ncbi:MAG: O-antigen ligase family protein [Rhodocyclaceae bacterium]|nr:O-antigen ligase family protein [Rhodocyclaceae bacterium]
MTNACNESGTSARKISDWMTLRSLAEQFGFGALLIFAAVWPLTHNAAIKNLSLVAMILALAVSVHDARLRHAIRSRFFWIMAGFALLALLSATWAVDSSYSLNAVRKHFIPVLVFFGSLVVFCKTRAQLHILITTLLISVGIRALGTLFEIQIDSRETGIFWKGFPLDAPAYIPLMLSLAFAFKDWRRYLGIFATMATLLALMLSGNRTGVVAAIVGGTTLLLLVGQRKQLLFSLIGLAAIAMILNVAQPELWKKFSVITDSASYRGPNAISGRGAIWQATAEIAMERPWLGHGFGWKTLGMTAKRDGFVDRWRTDEDPAKQAAAEYFSLPDDKINPHNLFLQLMYEVGLLGLSVYMVLFLLILVTAWDIWRRTSETLVLALIAATAAYATTNLTNGLWWGNGATLWVLPLLEIVRQSALPQAYESESSPHSP